MSWPSVTLAEVTTRAQYGAIARGSENPIGPLFVRQTDITSGRVDWSSVPYCDLNQSEFDKYAISPGDLLISRLGNGVGNAAIVRESKDAVFAGYLVRFKANGAVAIPEFLGYQLQSAQWREHVSCYRSGAAQPTLNAQQMGEFRFLLPPLNVQRGIAATLGTIDEKIDSNRRAIELLQSLIRSLFVGWKGRNPAEPTVSFGEFADVYGGATPKTGVREYWGGDIAWATPTDITALSAPYLFGTARNISERGLASTSATLHPAGTILMTSRATIGAFAVNEVPVSTNQGFIAVRPRVPHHRWFLLEEMRSRVPEMLDRANGSTFMELSRGNFKTISIGVPTGSALTELEALLSPLHARSSGLVRESAKLTAVRDTLLTGLLSSRVRVSETDGVLA